MATPNVIPNANNEGRIGKSGQQWSEIRGQSIYQDGNQVANLASPAFTGTPTVPTPAGGDDSTQAANTSWIRTLLAGWHKIVGAQTNGNLVQYNTASAGLEDAGETVATLKARASHTGTQANTTVDNDATLAYPGAATLADDLSHIDGLISTNAAAIAGKAASSHTHVSADVSDASTYGAADKLAKYGSGGGVFGTATAAYGVGITGSSSAANATGVFGTVASTSGIGISGYSGSGTTGATSAGLFAVGTTHTKRTILALADATNQNDIIEFGEGNAAVWTPWGFITSRGRPKMKNAGGFYQTLEPSAAAAVNQTLYLPNASGGTLVAGDGSGITGAAAFNTALGLGTANTPVFTAVQVTSSTSTGIAFSSGAKIALENAANTTTFQLPHGGGSTETLVDGDGRGITDASLFRTAIGALSAAGGTVTGTLILNPASGSTQLQLIGALGNAVNIVCNATAARTITLPDATGTIVVTASGGVAAADISDATATGQALITAATASAARTTLGVTVTGDALFIAASAAAARTALGAGATGDSLFTAATAAAARTTLDAPQPEDSLGYASAYNQGAGVTTTVSSSSTWYSAEEGATGVTILDSSGFAIPTSGTVIGLKHTGATTRKFWVTITFSSTVATASKSMQFALGKNGTMITGTEIGRYISSINEGAISVQGLVELAQNDEVTLMAQNRTDTTNFTIEDASICIRPHTT